MPITIEEKKIPWPGRPGKLVLNYFKQSATSPRSPSGYLLLGNNLYAYQRATVVAYGGTDSSTSCPGAETLPSMKASWPLNEVYSSLMSKLRSGGQAKLGMALAGTNQSLSMISKRFGHVNLLMEKALRRKAKGRLPKVTPKSLANDVLEYKFGWKQLVEDLDGAMQVIAGYSPDEKPRRMWVSARARVNADSVTRSAKGAEPFFTTAISGSGSLTCNACYIVTNPNVWLLNRLGLLNPVEVAWDRVPWSWVVNMFVNANQLIGSVSDTYGLTFQDGANTYSLNILREVTEQWNVAPWAGWRYFSNTQYRSKSRVPGVPLKPTLEFKLPGASLGLAVTASALAVQRSGRLLG